MKPSFTRRYRRRSKPAKSEGSFFKKESQSEPGFFAGPAHDGFFQPANNIAGGQSIQRTCGHCEQEEKKGVLRMEDKKEDDKKLQRAEDKKDEDKKMMRAPEKKEEDKKLMRAEDPKKEDDKKLQRAEEPKKEDDKKLQRAEDPKKEDDKKLQRVEEPKKDDDKKLQKKEAGAAPTAGASVSSYIGSLSGKGNSMPPLANQFFGSRMGYDFSNVKIHTDKEAAESAKSVNAKAYTVGNNIVFNEGQYNTGSQEGKRLLAHELTHVMQQNQQGDSHDALDRLQRKVSYTAPVPRKLDPIPIVLSGTNSTMGKTFISINGTKIETKDDFSKALANAFDNGVSMQYDPRTKTCNVSTANVSVDVSADISILTDPVNDKWSGEYPGSRVAGSRTCSKMSTVKIEMVSPSGGAAAFGQRIAADENEHSQDIIRLARRHIEAFDSYLNSLKIPSETGNDCAQKFAAMAGPKFTAMVDAFTTEWLAAVAVHDSATGNHHHKSTINPGNCNPVTITANS